MVDSMVIEPVAESQMGETSPSAHGLEVSVSFGRFENGLLSWDRWSSFSQNKYLEEVEKCSPPGSVAKKKAYFEAHYKNVAAKKQLEASLLMAEKLDGEALVASNKTLTMDQHRQPECDLMLAEKPCSENTVAVEKSKLKEQQNQSLVAEKPSGEIPTETMLNGKIESQPSDGQHHSAQVVEEHNLQRELASIIIDEHSKFNAAASGGFESSITKRVKEEPTSEASNIKSETVTEIALASEYETSFDDALSLVESQQQIDDDAGEIFKSCTREMSTLQPCKAHEKVLLANSERTVIKVMKAPIMVPPKPSQNSSSIPKKLIPKSTSSMMAASRSLTMKGSGSSVSRRESSYAAVVHGKLAPRYATRSPNPRTVSRAPSPFTVTKKSVFMVNMGNDDIVQRAFKSVQTNLGSVTSPAKQNDPLSSQVLENATNVEFKMPVTSQKGKEWVEVTDADGAKAGPGLAGIKNDITARDKRKEMQKIK